MKDLIIIEAEADINVFEIKKFEKNFNITLPSDYKEFLLKYNGGQPKENIFPLIEPIDNDIERGAEGGVSWFLALYDGYDINLVKKIQILKNRIPREMIPIADAFGGDKICLCVSGPNYGKVYYWDHENESPDENEPWYENVYLIANSFTDFINSLHEYKDPDEEPGES